MQRVTLAKISLVVVCQFQVLKFIAQNKQTPEKKKNNTVAFLLTLYFAFVTFATCNFIKIAVSTQFC